ncbi:glycosyltransferase family 10 domain-containing protein [Helicobacter typhlonius]|uniref:glycosyltransferase family 10 domain-containing protein n=1 Tax=Helicobacter typhlonius TaxID=76936 RepID=UPI002FDF4901
MAQNLQTPQDSKTKKRIYFCDGAVKGKIPAILSKHYDIEITPHNPDYVFYSVMGNEHINYDCIRIFSTGENVRADFNFCDYAIGFDYMQFEDRYLRYPFYLHYKEAMEKARNKHLHITPQTLENKKRFCTFVVSNGKADSIRSQFFDKLMQYKHIDSGGKYKNNIGAPVADKLAFLSEGKFNIAFENSSANGYTTEKLIEAFAAGTIPLYWGDESVSLPLDSSGGGVNPKSFVRLNDFASFEEAIAYIEFLDTHNDAYLAILREETFLDSNHEAIFDKKLESFLLHIFNQPLEKAYRRGFGQWRCNIEKRYKKYQRIRSLTNTCVNIIKNPIRRIKKLFK